MTASAHVLVFRPLIRILRGRGDDVEITARDYAQTIQLLELHGLEAEVIGRHGGRSRLQKARQMTHRLGALRPVRIGDRIRFSRKVMAEDELADPCAFGNAPDLVDIGVQRGHPLQSGTGEAVPPEVAEVGNLMDEKIGALGQRDQIVVHGGVA